MICEYCLYVNSYECRDGWNRQENCSDFKLDWDSLSERDKKRIKKELEKKQQKLYFKGENNEGN